MKPSSEEQIPYLKIGTEVSAKYRGAFCEAKVKHVEPMVKCRVTLKDFPGTFHIDHNAVRGGLDSLKVGADIAVLASAVDIPSNDPDNTFLPGTLARFNDASVYSVVFNDGDERTLRRSQLVLKGDKHFEESSTLDQLPLHNPEQFGTPVIGKRRGRTTRAGPSGSTPGGHAGSLGAGDDSGSESGQSGASGRVSHYVRRLAKLVGCIVKVGPSDATAGLKNVPSLVVVPSANPASEVRANQLLVKSYRDNRFHVVNVRSVIPMNREALVKEANASQDKGFVAAVERALLWLDSRELPHAWADRETLLGGPFGEASGGEEGSGGESSDSESGSTTQEQRDHWLAMLFNFMDSIGSPINKVPTVANKDLDLYRLARIVRRLGGSSRVSRDMRWPLVSSKMRLPPVSSAYASIRSAYARYLQQFEDFTRKIGTPSMSFPSGGRRTSATSRGGGGQLTPRERRPSQSQDSSAGGETRRKASIKEEAPASPPILTPRPSGEAPSSGGDSEPQPPTLVAAGSARDKRPKSLTLAAHTHSSSAPASPLNEAGKSGGKSRKAVGRRRKEEEAEEARAKTKAKARTPAARTPAMPGQPSVGDEVHVRCLEGGQSRVYQARINQLDAAGDRYNVHYKGWKKRYDEWIDSSRIIGLVKATEEPKEEVESEPETPAAEEPLPEAKEEAKPRAEGRNRQRRDRARSLDPVAKTEAGEETEARPAHRRSGRRQPRRGLVKSEPSSATEEEEKEEAEEGESGVGAEALKEEPSPVSPEPSPTPRTRRRRLRSETEREAKRPRAEIHASEQAAFPSVDATSVSTAREEESSEADSEEAAKSGGSPVDAEAVAGDAEAVAASRRPDVLSGQEEVVSKLDSPSTPSTDGMLVDKENVCSEEAVGEADDEDVTEEEEDDEEGEEEDEEEEEEEEGMEVDEEDDVEIEDDDRMEEEIECEEEEEEGTSMATGDEMDTMHGAEEEEDLSTAADEYDVESQAATLESSADDEGGSLGEAESRALRPRALESPPSPGSSQTARRRARFTRGSGLRPRSRTFSNGGPGPSSASSPEGPEPPTISLELPAPTPALSRLRPFVRPTPSFIPDNLDQVQSYEEREKILVDSIKACQQRWREVKQEMKELDREEAQRRAKRRRRKSSQNPPVLSAVYPTPPSGLLSRSAASTPDSTTPVPCIASSS